MKTIYITVLLLWRDVKAQKCRNDQPRDVNQSLEPQSVRGKHPAMHVLRYSLIFKRYKYIISIKI